VALTSVPVNLEAEETVLGAMILDRRAAEAAVAAIDSRMFYRESHATLFEVVRAVLAAGKPVDPLSVADAAERSGRLDAVGGKTRIAELVANVITTSNVTHYAAMVEEAWRRRSIVEAVTAILSDAQNGKPSSELLSDMESAAMDLGRSFSSRVSHVVPLFKGATLLDERLRNPLDETDGVAVPWGFLEPMKRGCLYVLGGYQADGKTAQAAHFLRAACEGGARVGLFSLEMPWEQMVARIAANLGAPASRVLSGNVRPPERAATAAAIARLAMLDADVIDHPRITTADIRRYQRVNRYDFVIVDHLHRFVIRDPRYERQELEAIIRDLTDLAREAEIPVLLLSQLSRTGDSKKPFPRPTMASLRGTAMLEAEATSVWFVWRERDEEGLATEVAHFICAKNRYGPVGSWKLYFSQRRVSFSEHPV